MACLLGATALFKLIALSTGTPLLRETDPVTGLLNRQVVILSAVIEVGIVLLLLSPARTKAWICVLPGIFGGGALLYRLVAFSLNVTQCPCLGGLSGSDANWVQFESSCLTAIALLLVISYPLCHLAFATQAIPHASK